ncbi:MAG: fibronectin type III domain-containing protein, partial [Eubacterium sp.]|nr:fibronectin type III domain-containing protein [Eubacterium sp.]
AGVWVVSNEETPEFSLSYSKNKNVGIARVDLVSKDNSRVLSQRHFVISPGKMTALSLASSGRAETSLQLAWSKTIGASGYEIEIYEDGNWFSEKKPAASSTSAKITNLNPATKYTFRIRSYVSALGKKYYSPYSKVYKTSTKPKSPKISSLSTKSKSITVKWKKVKCSGYEIEYSTDKSMKNAKTIKISSSKTVSKKIKNLKKGKKYYFRIRAFKNYTSASGKNCTSYSSRSAKNSIICK